MSKLIAWVELTELAIISTAYMALWTTGSLDKSSSDLGGISTADCFCFDLDMGESDWVVFLLVDARGLSRVGIDSE